MHLVEFELGSNRSIRNVDDGQASALEHGQVVAPRGERHAGNRIATDLPRERSRLAGSDFPDTYAVVRSRAGEERACDINSQQ